MRSLVGWTRANRLRTIVCFFRLSSKLDVEFEETKEPSCRLLLLILNILQINKREKDTHNSRHWYNTVSKEQATERLGSLRIRYMICCWIHQPHIDGFGSGWVGVQFIQIQPQIVNHFVFHWLMRNIDCPLLTVCVLQSFDLHKNIIRWTLFLAQWMVSCIDRLVSLCLTKKLQTACKSCNRINHLIYLNWRSLAILCATNWFTVHGSRDVTTIRTLIISAGVSGTRSFVLKARANGECQCFLDYRLMNAINNLQTMLKIPTDCFSATHLAIAAANAAPCHRAASKTKTFFFRAKRGVNCIITLQITR